MFSLRCPSTRAALDPAHLTRSPLQRVLGWAKSYTKKLDSQVMVEHDLDAVGALSIMWSMVQSTMPSEILDVVNSRLAEVGLPCLATRNVDEGFSSIFLDLLNIC